MNAKTDKPDRSHLIDVNVGLGFWPIQPFPWKSASALDKVLVAVNVTEAWVSAVESILFPEPDTYDFKLSRSLQGFPRLKLAKTVNPLLANWREGCGLLKPVALKLFPNYHGYALESDAADDVACYAAAKGLPLLVSLRVNDERNQPVAMQVHSVEARTLAAFSLKHPNTVMIALCPYRIELEALAAGSRNLLADIAFLDGVSRENPVPARGRRGGALSAADCLKGADTIARAIDLIGAKRIVFGSNSPFLYPMAAFLKMQQAGITAAKRTAIAEGNIRGRIRPRQSY